MSCDLHMFLGEGIFMFINCLDIFMYIFGTMVQTYNTHQSGLQADIWNALNKFTPELAEFALEWF